MRILKNNYYDKSCYILNDRLFYHSQPTDSQYRSPFFYLYFIDRYFDQHTQNVTNQWCMQGIVGLGTSPKC